MFEPARDMNLHVCTAFVYCAHAQCRGSIPLLWTQLPNIKYKPPTKLLEGGVNSGAFDAHCDAILDKYKVRQKSHWIGWWLVGGWVQGQVVTHYPHWFCCIACTYDAIIDKYKVRKGGLWVRSYVVGEWVGEAASAVLSCSHKQTALDRMISMHCDTKAGVTS
jgi:hypothetical protein